MSWKPTKVIPICTLGKRLHVEYEVYGDSNAPNRLEFRKGSRYLFEIIETNKATIPIFLSGLKHTWQSAPASVDDISIIDRALLWLLGGTIVASSEQHDIEFLNKEADTLAGSMSRHVSWTIYKLSRGDKLSLVLLRKKGAYSGSGMGQSSGLSFSWVKLTSSDVEVLLPELDTFCQTVAQSS